MMNATLSTGRLVCVLACCGALLLAGVVQTASATGITDDYLLSQLLGPSPEVPEIVIGNKRFFNFRAYSSVGDNPVNEADILVSVHPDPPAGEVGLLFRSESFSVIDGETQDTHFEFDVQMIGPGWLSDNTLDFVAMAIGPGAEAGIIETVMDDFDFGLASKQVMVTGDGINIISDHQDFPPPGASLIHVAKDVRLMVREENGETGIPASVGQSFAEISSFSQTFSMYMAPEPESLGLSLTGLMCLLGVRTARRRRRN